jgi:hypothetical protein
LSDKEQQIENDKDVGVNKEERKKDIQNESRRLNYQQSKVIAKERHIEKEAVCHRKEEEKRCQIIR